MLVPMILPNGTCTPPLLIAIPVNGTSILMQKKPLDLAKNPIDPDDGPVNIGFDDCCGGTRFGAGTVDEVVILSVALAQEDIEKNV